MTLQIGDVAPDFEADTTEGHIRFHDWLGDSWAVLFSHPKDFTPVCTTELGYMAKLKPEFDKRNVKIIGLSVDPVDKHAKWAKTSRRRRATRPELSDDRRPGPHHLQALRHAACERLGDVQGRTPADNQTVRNVFVIGPDKKIKLIIVYPMTTGRNFDEVLRVIDSLQLTAKHRVATPVNWKQGEDVIIAGSVSNDEARSSTRTAGRRRGPTSVSCRSRAREPRAPGGASVVFRQLFDAASSTYSYLLASRRGGEALIIDPVYGAGRPLSPACAGARLETRQGGRHPSACRPHHRPRRASRPHALHHRDGRAEQGRRRVDAPRGRRPARDRGLGARRPLHAGPHRRLLQLWHAATACSPATRS